MLAKSSGKATSKFLAEHLGRCGFSRATCHLWFSVQELPLFQFKLHVD